MHKVKCYFCKKDFDRDKVPYEKVSDRRYAHVQCYEQNIEAKKKEDLDYAALEQYIKELLNVDKLSTKIYQQIRQYKEKNYTYSGMLKTLKYFYEVKGNSKEKANGGIGIIPYVYDDAFNYYYTLWENSQKNVNKDIQSFVPEETVIKIPIPTVKKREKKFFTFLMEEN